MENLKQIVELALAKIDAAEEIVEGFKIVNRVRGGKIQRRKKVSDKDGYTIKDGKLSKISAKERMARKLGAKKAAKKRKGKQTTINKKRAISNRKSARIN